MQPPGDMPEPVYDCELCHDARFVHGRLSSGAVDYSQVIPCDCQFARIETARKEHLMETCELPPGTDGLTFEEFNQVPGTEDAYEAAWELAQAGGNALLWLLLAGPPDRGKTHLAIAACHVRIDRGEPALYTFVPDLLRDLRRGFGKDDYQERFDRYCEVPLLVLDDLGTENATSWVQQELDSIVNYRSIRRLPLIVTTNLTPNQLAPRILSRLQRAEFGKIISITSGEYWRTK